MFENETNRVGPIQEPVSCDADGSRDLGTTLNRCVEAVADQVATQVWQQSECHTKLLQSKIQTLVAAVEEMRRMQRAVDLKIEGLVAQNRLLERASREHAQLSEEHYRQHVIEPMARMLLPAIDVIDRTVRQNHEEAGQAGDFPWSLFEQVQVYLAQFLSFYDIKAVRHAPGSSFDPKVMNPAGFVACHEKGRDGHVAKSLQPGLRRGIDSVLRFETVILYRYETSSPDLSTQGKGGQDGTSD